MMKIPEIKRIPEKQISSQPFGCYKHYLPVLDELAMVSTQDRRKGAQGIGSLAR